MSGFYEDKIFPIILDVALRKLQPDRQKLVSQMRGRVLEVGVGTGANLPYYHADAQVVGIEPGAAMLGKARKRVDRVTNSSKQAMADITLQQASAHDLPFADQSFDQVLMFLVLCTIPDAARAVAEAMRVLRPGGEMHFFEHVQAPDAGVARWQDRINPLWRKFACGCNLNRTTASLLTEKGLAVQMRDQGYHPNMGLRVASYVIQGVATKPVG